MKANTANQRIIFDVSGSRIWKDNTGLNFDLATTTGKVTVKNRGIRKGTLDAGGVQRV